MRIVFLCNSFWPNIGGAELVCKDIVDTLSQQHDVTVITQPTHLSRSNSKYKICELNAVTSYSMMAGLKEKLVSLSPDIIISFGYGKSFSDVSSRFAHRNNIPFVFMPCGDFHTNKTALSKRTYGLLMGRTCFRNATKIITATEWEKQHWMKQYFIPEDKFSVIPYNLPKKFEEYTKSKNFAFKDKKYLLYIGRTGPNKRLDLLLDSFVMFPTPNIELVVAGKGTDADHIKDSLIGDKDIHFVGQVTEDEKKELIDNAHAVVFPSTYESFGMVLLEACAFKTPYLMSNIPPFKELSPDNPYVFENNLVDIGYQIKKANKNPKFVDIKVPNFKNQLNNVIKFL